jgi:hypothetical protein
MGDMPNLTMMHLNLPQSTKAYQFKAQKTIVANDHYEKK